MESLYTVTSSDVVDITSRLLSINDDILTYHVSDVQNESGVTAMNFELPDFDTCPITSFEMVVRYDGNDGAVTTKFTHGTSTIKTHTLNVNDDDVEVWFTFTKGSTAWSCTTRDYYAIYDYYDLYDYANKINDGRRINAMLQNDLDSTTDGYSSGSTWKQIGYSSSVPFTNTFDGNEKTIVVNNLQISQNGAGSLFNYTDGATINNLTASGSLKDSSSYYYIGGLVCQANNSTISGCNYKNGNTYVSGSFGGIVYKVVDSEVTSCTVSSGTVTPTDNTHIYGGIVAYVDAGSTISGCSSVLVIKSTGNMIGGIVGTNYGTVTGCSYTPETYTSSEPSLTGTYYVGGIVGYSGGGTVSGCYLGGSTYIDCTDGNIGGIIGHATGTTVSDCYVNGDLTINSKNIYTGGIIGGVSNGGSIEGCEIKTGKTLTLSTTADDKGYSYIGGIVGGQPYNTTDTYPITDCLLNNASTVITCTGEYAGGIVGCNRGGMGYCSINNSVKISAGGKHAGGIAGYVISGNIDNCNVVTNTGSYIKGSGNYAGGIVGELGTGNISGCGVTMGSSSYITGSGGNYVGGISGIITTGDISSCTVSLGSGSYVSGSDLIGGITGSTNNGDLDDCSVTLNSSSYVSGSNYIGGISGSVNYGSGNTLENCNVTLYSGSKISGTKYIAGIAGNNEGAITSCNISNSSSSISTNITGSSSHVGGIAGNNSTSGYITNCSVNGDETYTGSYGINIYGSFYIGGLVGYNSGSISGTSVETDDYDYSNYCSCYAGSVKCSDTNTSGGATGGLIGHNNSGATAKYLYNYCRTVTRYDGNMNGTISYKIGNDLGTSNYVYSWSDTTVASPILPTGSNYTTGAVYSTSTSGMSTTLTAMFSGDSIKGAYLVSSSTAGATNSITIDCESRDLDDYNSGEGLTFYVQGGTRYSAGSASTAATSSNTTVYLKNIGTSSLSSTITLLTSTYAYKFIITNSGSSYSQYSNYYRSYTATAPSVSYSLYNTSGTSTTTGTTTGTNYSGWSDSFWVTAGSSLYTRSVVLSTSNTSMITLSSSTASISSSASGAYGYFTVNPNTTSSSRSATISVKYWGTTKSFTIYQAGDPAYAEPEETTSVYVTTHNSYIDDVYLYRDYDGGGGNGYNYDDMKDMHGTTFTNAANEYYNPDLDGLTGYGTITEEGSILEQTYKMYDSDRFSVGCMMIKNNSSNDKYITVSSQNGYVTISRTSMSAMYIGTWENSVLSNVDTTGYDGFDGNTSLYFNIAAGSAAYIYLCRTPGSTTSTTITTSVMGSANPDAGY